MNNEKQQHQGDPGEVERLREEIDGIGGLRERLSDMTHARDLFFGDVKKLRAQLAEAHALLEDWHTANCTGEVNVSDKAYRIVTRTAAMLNANTEPSVPVARDARSDIAADAAYRNGVMHGYKLAMEGDEADYQTCIKNLTDHLRSARVTLSASAEPSKS